MSERLKLLPLVTSPFMHRNFIQSERDFGVQASRQEAVFIGLVLCADLRQNSHQLAGAAKKEMNEVFPALQNVPLLHNPPNISKEQSIQAIFEAHFSNITRRHLNLSIKE